MIDKKKIFELMDKVNEAKLNDPIVDEYFDEIVKNLEDNSREILTFLNSISDEQLYDMIQVFGELSLKFDTWEFASELARLEDKATKAVTEAYQQTRGARS